MSDKVHISGLLATAIVGLDHWQKPAPHPVSVDMDFSTDFAKALDSDNLHYSLNYAVISDKVATFLRQNHQRNFHSLGGLGDAIFDLLETERKACSAVSLEISAPKLDIRAPVLYSTGGGNGVYHIKGLRTLTLIGVFTFERLHKQYVVLDLDLCVPKGNLAVPEVSKSVSEYLEKANFKTVEALVKRTAQWILQNFQVVEGARVRVTKPNAIVYTEGVGVSVESTRADFADEEPIVLEQVSEEAFNLPVQQKSDYSGLHTAFVAFGSNQGNQVDNIKKALDHLGKTATIEATSSLYVSKPMYYTDQADFFNGVVRISFSDLSPHQLLSALKDIEYGELSRTKDFDNGPRTIDLDLVLYDNATVTSPDLVVPHKAMLERTFVLQPLCELLSPDYIHPVTAEPVHNHLAKLLASAPDPKVQESSDLQHIIPANGKMLEFGSSTLLMGIFNATPDLFSDGGARFGLDRDSIVEAALKMAEDGAQIIDIGGASTRPGSVEPLVEEELRRVVPAVEAIRSEEKLRKVFVSVDTYRSEVAEAALKAGADIVNDVSMGLYDPKIFEVVAQYGCGYVMNHTRGTTATMLQLTHYGAGPELLVEYHIDSKCGILAPLAEPAQTVINGICRELAAQIQLALALGVRRWQIILDPGIGFAKDVGQNLAVLRNASRVKNYAQFDSETQKFTSFHGMPMLVGTSRKRFLGTITGRPPKERTIATAASVVTCVEQNTDIVRVHDVAEVKEALQMADAIYRGNY